MNPTTIELENFWRILTRLPRTHKAEMHAVRISFGLSKATAEREWGEYLRDHPDVANRVARVRRSSRNLQDNAAWMWGLFNNIKDVE